MRVKVNPELLDPHTEDETQAWVLARILDADKGIVEIPNAVLSDDNEVPSC